MGLRRWVAAATIAAGLWAGQAAACPACAGRDNENPNRTTWFIAAMMVLPWTVAAGVVLTIRRMQRDSEEPAPASGPLHHGDANEP